MGEVAIVSGATGLLGSHLVAGLLESRADLEVVCLARRRPGPPTSERVARAIGRVRERRGRPAGEEGWEGRLRVAELDLARAGPEGEAELLEMVRDDRVDEFWHCAETSDCRSAGSTIWRTNVEGLYLALRLAELCGVLAFNHVSSASVAGARVGRIPEAISPRPAEGFRGPYEESKHAGEEMVARQCRSKGMQFRIFRPGLLVGPPWPAGPAARAGIGPFLDLLKTFRDGVVAGDPSYFDRHALRVLLDREATINLVPVETAVAEMLDLGSRDSATFGQVFHITGEPSLGVYDLLQAVLPVLGIPRFELARSEDELMSIDRHLDRLAAPFRPYLSDRKVFDRSNVARFGADRHQAGRLMDLDRVRRLAADRLRARRFAGTPATIPMPSIGPGTSEESAPLRQVI